MHWSFFLWPEIDFKYSKIRGMLKNKIKREKRKETMLQKE